VPASKTELEIAQQIDDRDTITEVLENGTGRVLHVEGPEVINEVDLAVQYHDRLHSLRLTGFLDESGEAKPGDVPPPSFEQVRESFTPEEKRLVHTILDVESEPTLSLVPEMSFDAMKKVVDKHIQKKNPEEQLREGLRYIGHYPNAHFVKNDPTKNLGENICGWRAVMVGDLIGAQEEGGRNQIRTYRDIIFNQRKNSAKGIKGMDRNKLLMFVLENFIKGNRPPTPNKAILLDDEFPTLTELLELQGRLDVDIDNIKYPHISFMTYMGMPGGVFFGSSNCYTRDGDSYNVYLVPTVGGGKVLK
jgi:hypothetical protein